MSAMKKMKALAFTGYGPLEKNIRWIDTPVPVPESHGVLIKISAMSINPVDIKTVKGNLRMVNRYRLPARFGYDASGTVIETGDSVTGFKPGDEVFLRADRDAPGTFAEYISVPYNYAALKPASCSHNEAASFPLVDRAEAVPGQSILIHAGSGGVGTFAIQFAKHLGLHVTTTVNSENEGLVRFLGADEVIKYDIEDYREGGARFDIVYDTLGGGYTRDAFTVTNTGGTVVSLAGPPDNYFAQAINAPLHRSILFYLAGSKIRYISKKADIRYFRFLTESNGTQLSAISDLADSGVIKPVIDKVFPFNKLEEALAYTEKGHLKGKVIIEGPL